MNEIVKRVLKKLENHLYYDVLISYHSPDVKKTLARHLYHRLLAQYGLRVFLDTKELPKGDRIFFQIKRTIATTSFHIAIFSPKFEKYNWWVDDIILMLASGLRFIPIFYHVDPSEVIIHNGYYAQALSKLEGKTIYDYQTNEKLPRYDAMTIEN